MDSESNLRSSFLIFRYVIDNGFNWLTFCSEKPLTGLFLAFISFCLGDLGSQQLLRLCCSACRLAPMEFFLNRAELSLNLLNSVKQLGQKLTKSQFPCFTVKIMYQHNLGGRLVESRLRGRGNSEEFIMCRQMKY